MKKLKERLSDRIIDFRTDSGQKVQAEAQSDGTLLMDIPPGTDRLTMEIPEDPEFGCGLSSSEYIDELLFVIQEMKRDAAENLQMLEQQIRDEGLAMDRDKLMTAVWGVEMQLGPGDGLHCSYQSPRGMWCGFHDHRGEMIDGKWYCRAHRLFMHGDPPKPVAVPQPAMKPREPTARLIVDLPAWSFEDNDSNKEAVLDAANQLATELYDTKVPVGDVFLSITHYDPATGKPMVVFRTRREDLNGEGCTW